MNQLLKLFRSSFQSIVLVSLMLLAEMSICQTPRYWSMNFASEPSILAGAVVGGFAENLAIYYNPAIIYENKSENISFSGEIVALDFYKAKNAFGLNQDLKNSQFNVLPSFLSIYIKPKNNNDLSFQLALLTRDKSDIDITESITGNGDIYSGVTGLENYSVLYGTVIRYTDLWIGAGASYRINKNLSLGLSSFLSIKRLDDKLTKSINIIPDVDSSAVVPSDSSYWYSNARDISRLRMNVLNLRLKIGLQYKVPPWSMGLNVSLPSLHLFGTAERYREFGANSVYNNEDAEFFDDFVFVGSNKDLPATYKDPFSIAFGINYSSDIEKNMIGLCVEYFHEIPVYEMVDAENVSIISKPQILQDNDFLSVWHGARSLINLAIGTRQYINPRLTLLGGFQTDFDYLKGVDFVGTSNENNNFVNYYTDVMHIMAGARFTISKHRFIIGTQFSFGSEDQLRQVGDFRPNIVNQENALPVENLVEVPVTYSYNGLALFFGFIFNFVDDEP